MGISFFIWPTQFNMFKAIWRQIHGTFKSSKYHNIATATRRVDQCIPMRPWTNKLTSIQYGALLSGIASSATGIWNQWRFKPLFYAICIFLQPRCDDNRWHIANIDKTIIIVNGSVDSKSVAIAVSLSVLGGLGRCVGQSSQEESLWPPGLDYRDYTNKTTCLCIGFAMLWYAQVDLRDISAI